MEFLTERCLRRKIEPEKIADGPNALTPLLLSAPRRVPTQPIRTKGLTASALAAKFRDEFETVRCSAVQWMETKGEMEGGEERERTERSWCKVELVKVKIDIVPTYRAVCR